MAIPQTEERTGKVFILKYYTTVIVMCQDYRDKMLNTDVCITTTHSLSSDGQKNHIMQTCCCCGAYTL